MPYGTSCTDSTSTLTVCFSKRAGEGIRGERIVFWSEIFDSFQSEFDLGLTDKLMRVKFRVEISFGLAEPPERPNLAKLRYLVELFSDDLREVLRSEYQLYMERKGGMAFSISGRSGNRLPQIHADRISISDHLITSTLSQVESKEFEYLTTNLSRMMLVMEALFDVSSCCKRNLCGRATYKDPTLIKKITPIFFLVLICRFHTTGSGRRSMMISSTMLRPAPVNPMTAETGRHLALVIVLSQMELMGKHWKTTRRKKTRPWIYCHRSAKSYTRLDRLYLP